MTRSCWMTLALVLLFCGCRSAGRAKVEQAEHAPETRSLIQKSRGFAGKLNSKDLSESQIQQVASEVSESTDRVAPVSIPVQSLSLPESISLGLAQNPDLIAVRQNENVSAAALGVAETYPFNPYVQVQATPYQNQMAAGPGTTYHYVLLMQTIQLAHQQRFREEGAEFALNSTRWNIHQAELLNIAQTERLYFTVLYLQGILDLANASHQNNQVLLNTLEKQLDAGQATAADVAIVQIDARSTKQQVRLAKANYETALRDLKRQLGLSPDDPTKIEGDLVSFQWTIPSLALAESNSESRPNRRVDLIADRVSVRPDVMAAQADVDTARAALCLATANKTPDLQIGPYYQRTADGTTFLGLRAHMDIPVMNSGRPLEEQRISEFGQRVTVWQQLKRRAELEAEAAFERYDVAHTALMEDLPDGVSNLPKELENLEQQFVAGEVDVVRVVQARTSIIQNQRVRLDLLNEMAQSAANLTAASAIPLEEMLAPLK